MCFKIGHGVVAEVFRFVLVIEGSSRHSVGFDYVGTSNDYVIQARIGVRLSSFIFSE